jgi:hypothetical protein
MRNVASKRSPDERSDIRDVRRPAYRSAHAGYLLCRHVLRRFARKDEYVRFPRQNGTTGKSVQKSVHPSAQK